jgi:hypothetical protein
MIDVPWDDETEPQGFQIIGAPGPHRVPKK